MSGASSTVFIVDDYEEIRVGLTRLLGAAGYRVRSFESAERFFEENNGELPGCVLLDICMPGMSGLDMQRALVGSTRTRPIIFLTGYGDSQMCADAMKIGAVDFLTKPIEDVRLFAAVDRAFQLDLAHRNSFAVRRGIEERYETLSPRERQVMDEVIPRYLNKQIGVDLGIGEKNVKAHRARVISKMDARSVPVTDPQIYSL
jgi:FixJ family two-component response regulator